MSTGTKNYKDNTRLVGDCKDPKVNDDGSPWLIPFGLPKEQIKEMLDLVNERGWLNGAFKLTSKGWVIQVQLPTNESNKPLPKGDDLPF